MRHLHENHLNEGEFRRQTLDDTLDALEEMPDFPFSDGIQPCSAQCIYHNMRDEIPPDTFKSLAKQHRPPPTLLCLEGEHRHGQGKDYSYRCGVGCCKHCGYEGFECTRRFT